MRVAAALLVSACCLAMACRDVIEVDVCDRPHACKVPGWDLLVVAPALDNAAATDPGTGLPIAPRDLRVRFTVQNRGSEVSLPRRTRSR